MRISAAAPSSAAAAESRDLPIPPSPMTNVALPRPDRAAVSCCSMTRSSSSRQTNGELYTLFKNNVTNWRVSIGPRWETVDLAPAGAKARRTSAGRLGGHTELELLPPPQHVVSFGFAKALNAWPRPVVAPPLATMTPASAATLRAVRIRERLGRVVEEVCVASSVSVGVACVDWIRIVLRLSVVSGTVPLVMGRAVARKAPCRGSRAGAVRIRFRRGRRAAPAS